MQLFAHYGYRGLLSILAIVMVELVFLDMSVNQEAKSGYMAKELSPS
ncbi:hypothetical protein [Polycladomyces subterraneus]|jgi:hypothetical protein|uniref:Uncharacterized protein n=1 Tax=Polycladomyces subterraneus TaxID=1016997 RepID=A0ABT8IQY1_9BACL|nr:hypothetical protein [Polycladomyces subterraneus]MDN4595211.1 hypothetical protein [Polycladomyces subterraneus]